MRSLEHEQHALALDLVPLRVGASPVPAQHDLILSALIEYRQVGCKGCAFHLRHQRAEGMVLGEPVEPARVGSRKMRWVVHAMTNVMRCSRAWAPRTPGWGCR